MECLYAMLSGSLLMQDDATPTDTAPEEEDEAVSADGDNAEQDRADTKYREASAAAVAKCADDTKGQTCFICMEGIHPETNEGLVRGCACRGAAGFAHVSCLARQAKVLVAEAEERDLDDDAFGARWRRWDTCSVCKQDYHGVVACALGWACWKTYVGRPETDEVRGLAMAQLGNGLGEAKHHEEALSVQEARLSLMPRVGASEDSILIVRTCLANSLTRLGRNEQASNMLRDVYSGRVRLNGEEHIETISAALNYAGTLCCLKRFKEARSLMRKPVLVSRRILGETNATTLKMRWSYAQALYLDTGATFDDLREVVATLEEIEPIARRVLGGAHPLVMVMQQRDLKGARAALAARETPEAEKLAQDAFRTARAKIAQERSGLADAMATMTTGDA